MERRRLSDGTEVSVVSIGSWQTFERMPFEDSVAVLERAFEHGITFFDNARYGNVPPNERGESQPIPPGSPLSEVVFGRAMAATGRPRESYVLSNKLWFDTYPRQSFAEQVDASVRRLGLHYIDVIFCQVPLPGIEIADLAREMGGIVASGRAKVWGTVNWTPEQMREAHAVAAQEGFAPPTLTEIKYSVMRRWPAEAADYTSVFRELGVGIHASNVFEGGLLTDKYATMDELAARRILPEDLHGAREAYFARREAFVAAAEALGVKPAQLALAFAIANDTVVSALIGATRPEQVDDAAGAARLAAERGAELRERLRDFAELKAAAGS